MSKLVLYGMDISPPVHACLLTLRALDITFEYVEVDLISGEQKKEEFVKKNPQHTVPLLEDDGTCIWDSHAICSYLVDKYGKTDDLYPKDLVKRAHVQQRLYFDASVLFMSLKNICTPFIQKDLKIVPQEKIDNIRDGYTHLETFLGDNPYVTGDTLTIADFCCAATVSSLPAFLEIDPETFPKITTWLARLSELPYYQESNADGVEKYIALFKGAITIV